MPRDDYRPPDHAVRQRDLIPVTLELGGKSPNIFFEDVAAASAAFYDKALEGFTMFALNQGEVCTCPSRALIQASIYHQFLGDVTKRTEAIVQRKSSVPWSR